MRGGAAGGATYSAHVAAGGGTRRVAISRGIEMNFVRASPDGLRNRCENGWVISIPGGAARKMSSFLQLFADALRERVPAGTTKLQVTVAGNPRGRLVNMDSNFVDGSYLSVTLPAHLADIASSDAVVTALFDLVPTITAVTISLWNTNTTRRDAHQLAVSVAIKAVARLDIIKMLTIVAVVDQTMGAALSDEIVARNNVLGLTIYYTNLAHELFPLVMRMVGPKSNMQELHLQFDRLVIREYHWRLLERALRDNTTLHTLDVHIEIHDAEIAIRLRELLRHNRTLRSMSIEFVDAALAYYEQITNMLNRNNQQQGFRFEQRASKTSNFGEAKLPPADR
jgi:hypothetical protein